MTDRSSLADEPSVSGLARELVRAFAATGGTRAAMPAGREAAVRELLTRAVANRGVLDEYRRALAAAFRAERTALPPDLLPLPLYDSAEVAEHGFARLGPDALAAIALDSTGHETIDELLNREILLGESDLVAGGWYAEAVARWGAAPPDLPEWLDQAISVPPTPGSAPTEPGYRSRPRPRVWAAAAAAATVAGLSYAAVFYRKGEFAHASLDRYGQELTDGHFVTAVSQFQTTESICEGSWWPVPASATRRFERARAAPDLLEKLPQSPDLDGAEAALRLAVDGTSLGRNPGYEFALGMTLRRRGDLAEAGQRFESVVNRLANRDGGDPPAVRDEGPDPSARPPVMYTSAVVGTTLGSNSALRLAYAVTLLEAGRYQPAKQLLLRHAGADRDRPFGAAFHLWLAERLLALDPTVPAPPAGGPPPAAPADLRDHALLHLYRGHYTTAADLFSRALAHPEYGGVPLPPGSPVDPVRYFAAAAAVRAGRAGDKDSPQAAEAERWHDQAAEWAAADLRLWSEAFARPADGVSLAAAWYNYVRYDYFLAVARDRPLTAAMPAAERAGWDKHWGELDRRFGGLRPDKPPGDAR